MTSLFRRFLSVSTRTPQLIKINGTIQLDSSDPTVMKITLELRQKWRDQDMEETRSDVYYHPPSSDTRYITPVISSSPKEAEYEMTSALAQLMKDYKD